MFYRDLKMDINSNELHLLEWPGSKDAIICIHGLTCNGHWWEKLAERLSPEYKVISYDLPGRGDSSIPTQSYGYKEHSDDIKTIIDKLNLNKVTLIGHSLGANIACYFAYQNPNRIEKIVLIDGGMDPPRSVLDALKPSIDRLGNTYSSFSEYLKYIRRMPFFADWSDYWEKYLYYDVVHCNNGNVMNKMSKEYLFEEIMSLSKTKINDYHLKITIPELIIWAPKGLLLPNVFVLTREKGEDIANIKIDNHFVAIKDTNHFSIMINDQTILEIEHYLKRL